MEDLDHAKKESTSVIIGNDATSEEPVAIDSDAQWHSVYIIGLTGTGKTTLIESITRQNIKNGDGLCFIDPGGDAAENLLACIPTYREKDLIYWNPVDTKKPFGFNPFECDPENPVALSLVAQNFVFALENLAEFQEVFTAATQMRETLLNLARAFAANQGHSFSETLTFLDTTDLGRKFRKSFYEKLGQYNPPVCAYWERFDNLTRGEQTERVKAPINKLAPFVSDPIIHPIFTKKHSFYNFRAPIDEGKILIVRLADIGSYNASFIGALVVAGLWSAAQSRADIPEKERRRFHIIADEFQDYMTGAFSDIQTKGRKYGLDTVIAHQNRGRLNNEMRSSTLGVKNKIVFNIDGSDAIELAREFDRTPPQPLVPKQRPMLALALDPLHFLGSHGHVSKEVQDLYIEVRAITGRVYFSWRKTTGEVRLGQYLTRRMMGNEDTAASFSSLMDVFYICYVRMYEWEKFIQNTFEDLRRVVEEAKQQIELVTHKITEHEKNNHGKGESYYRDIHSSILSKKASEEFLLGIAKEVYKTKNEYERYHREHANDDRENEIFQGVRDVSNWLVSLKKRLLKDEIPHIKDNPEKWKGNQNFISCCTKSMEELRVLIEKLPVDIEAHLKSAETTARASNEEWRYHSTHKAYTDELYKRKQDYAYLEMVYNSICVIVKLGDALARDPIMVPSGQYETVYERPISDVENQIADRLVNLPYYTANCVLIQDKKPVVVKIVTLESPKLEPERITHGQELKRLSQDLYSRDREDGESVAVKSSTPKPDSSPPLVSVPLQTDDEDDDSIVTKESR